MNKLKLVEELSLLNKEMLDQVEFFETLGEEKLKLRCSENSWSVLECMEHLNRYAAFYVPEITRVLGQNKPANETVFKSNWLGDYFVHSVAPKEKLNTMKTFKVMDPQNDNLDIKVLFQLKNYLIQMDELLNKAKNYSFSKIKTRISISKWIKIKLGDTFRVVIYHNQRHFNQMYRVIKDLEKNGSFHKVV